MTFKCQHRAEEPNKRAECFLGTFGELSPRKMVGKGGYENYVHHTRVEGENKNKQKNTF